MGTYSYTDPPLTAKDRIRFALWDTDTGVDESGDSLMLRSDEAINEMLRLYTEPLATAALADSLASQFAAEPDSVSVSGAVAVGWSQRVQHWQKLAARLRAEVAAALVTPNAAMIGQQAMRYGDEPGAEYVRPHAWWWPDA